MVHSFVVCFAPCYLIKIDGLGKSPDFNTKAMKSTKKEIEYVMFSAS